MTNKIYILILILFSLSSCKGKIEKTKNRTDKEIDSLIQNHSKDFIFLSFWENMSKLDFKEIIERENKKGNLIDGKFILNLGSDKIEFSVKQHANYISLNFEDNYMIDKNTANPNISGESEYWAYKRLVEKVEEHFDSKYRRKIIPNAKVTETKRHDFFGNLINPPIRIWISSNENNRVFWLGKSIYFNDKSGFSFSPNYIGKKELLASCNITITISSYDTFIIEQKTKIKEEVLRKKEEKLKKENIKNHNNLL